MRIKEVETLVGITRKNIRFYEKEGLLSPGRESENSYRDYTDGDVERLKRIKLLRKLDMPLGEIRSVLEGERSLASALKRHSIAIAEQRDNLMRSIEMCALIEADGTRLDELDADGYLLRLENMEKEGAVFPNIVKKDVMKKYLGPILACAAVLVIAVAVLVFTLISNSSDPAPGYMIVYICAAIAIVVIGTVAALLHRISEIRKGEEDDLGNY